MWQFIDDTEGEQPPNTKLTTEVSSQPAQESEPLAVRRKAARPSLLRLPSRKGTSYSKIALKGY